MVTGDGPIYAVTPGLIRRLVRAWPSGLGMSADTNRTRMSSPGCDVVRVDARHDGQLAQLDARAAIVDIGDDSGEAFVASAC